MKEDIKSKTLLELQNNIISRIKANEKPLDLISNIIDDMCIYTFKGEQCNLKDDFDISVLKENAKIVYNSYYEAYYPENFKERKEALKNTLSDYEFYNYDNDLEEAFEVFSIYDKIIIIDDKKYLYKLFGLLYTMNLHYEQLQKYKKLSKTNDVIKKGTALSTNSNIKEYIAPRIRTFKVALAMDETNKSNKLMLNLFLEYNKNPLEIDMMLKHITSYDKSLFHNVNQALLNTLYSSRNTINSSCSIDDEDIFQSIQINIFYRYFKHSHLDKCLRIKKKLSHSKIAKYANYILEKVFDMEESNLKYTHFSKPIQLKSHFDDLEIYQFRTSRNYVKHPVFE